jgi:hypothetical protein
MESMRLAKKLLNTSVSRIVILNGGKKKELTLTGLFPIYKIPLTASRGGWIQSLQSKKHKPVLGIII